MITDDICSPSFRKQSSSSGHGVTGTNSDAILALMPETGKFVNFRVPYPLGFNTRWLEGRLDDPAAGWKGRAVWATWSDVPAWHQEAGEEGRGPELVKFQLWPDPLAH